MHLQSVTVYVSDQDRALDFYTKKLGFEVRQDQPMGEGMRWIAVAPPGAQTAIILARGFGDWSQDRVGTFTGVVLGSDDIQADYERLSQAGVPFSEPPTRQPWGGVQALLADQDGNGYVMVGTRLS